MSPLAELKAVVHWSEEWESRAVAMILVLFLVCFVDSVKHVSFEKSLNFVDSGPGLFPLPLNFASVLASSLPLCCIVESW